MKYCTYITIYRGNKLPPFYVGSTCLQKIESGYRGSVSSKAYSQIWKQELRDNPQLFVTKIIRIYASRTEALEKEALLQKKLNVVKHPLYVNKSVARKNGFFGMSSFGPDHHRTGVKHTESTKALMSKTRAERMTPEKLEKKRLRMRLIGQGKLGGMAPCPESHKARLSQLKKGVPLSAQHIQNISAGVTAALARPDVHAKLGKHMLGKKISSQALFNRCQRCTVDGIKIYESRKALLADLGSGKNGWRHPTFRYLKKE